MAVVRIPEQDRVRGVSKVDEIEREKRQDEQEPTTEPGRDTFRGNRIEDMCAIERWEVAVPQHFQT